MLFTTTVMAGSTDEAIARVGKYADKAGVATTGRAAVRDERHRLVDVETQLLGSDRNNAWVVLTSFGMTPSAGLGSHWQTVEGVGR